MEERIARLERDHLELQAKVQTLGTRVMEQTHFETILFNIVVMAAHVTKRLIVMI